MVDEDETARGEREADAGDAALQILLAGQIAQTKLLTRILELLTASSGEEGPGLSKLLEVLIATIKDQSRYLRDVSSAIAKLGHDLPLHLIAAIDENLDIQRRTENGHAEGSDPS